MRVLFALIVSLALTAAAPAQDAAPADTAADAPIAEAPVCGTETISIARMQWPSAAILAYIHAGILKSQFSCDVQVVAGDLNATTSSIATTGRPLVAPEVWLPRVAAIWNSALETGRVRQAAPTYSGGPLEGWFVPDYVAKDNPELKSAADILDHWQVFSDGGSRARFLSCPADWACAIINANLVKAYGLDKRFDIEEPASRFALDQVLGETVSRHEPILFYYWQPNGVLAQLGFTPLDMGAFDANALSCLAEAECTNPAPSSFPPEPVVIAISDDLFTLAPALAAYFQRASMPLDEMNRLLAHMSETGVSPEQTAQFFIETRPEIWTSWVAR